MTLTAEDLSLLSRGFDAFFFDILGMKQEADNANQSEMTDDLMDLIIELRKNAKAEKNWAIADAIRDKLKQIGIVINDTKEGVTWEKL